MKNFLMIVPIAFVMLFSTMANAAEDINFIIFFDGTMTDGSSISFDAVSARIDCGLANDGSFADWTLNIANFTPDAVTGNVTRTIKPPTQSDYWCIATIIETATGLESDPSNVKMYDLLGGVTPPPPVVNVPSTPTLDGTVTPR